MILKKFKTVYCDYVQFDEALSYARKLLDIHKVDKVIQPDDIKSQWDAYIKIDRTNVNLWYKRDRYKYNFRFRLDEEEQYTFNGMQAYSILKQYYKELPDLTKDPYYGFNRLSDETYEWMDGISSCAGIVGFNEKYMNQRHHNCYGYDLNSAFTFAMLNDMPDTSKHPREFDYVKSGEIGFDYDENGDFTCLMEGHYAKYVFPLMKSPFTKFATTWYERKKNAQTKKEKDHAKAYLNYAVGYLQRKNPFLRCAIIYYSNTYIKSFIDENTLYWNTDSIVSLVPRPDIEKNIGKELGQWKIEHQGDFAYTGYSYQWNKTKPCVRGVSKKWFKGDFDILTMKIPSEGNLYQINEKFQLRRVR